ncbi:helix-turn-helix domain-containing protein [Hyalangium minutum]|uniref:Putative transcriptional repressor n=1 Tax=Hyalangium minutum TaxID=394096 RepID=A0A085W3N3_9BACT|nr:helix-turn-helix transcriptional regulator [Hyalangium minutum]KFE62296.1 putative transcriptional repressor [Hyalangium minutum]
MDKELTETLKKVIGPNIRKARQRQGLSQARLAEMVEMSTEVLGRMERKKVLPRLERLVLLRKILGMTPDQMLGFSSGPGSSAALKVSPAYDEMMTVMRHFFTQMESRLSEQERRELMQTLSHLQRLITLIKKKRSSSQPRRVASDKKRSPKR